MTILKRLLAVIVVSSIALVSASLAGENTPKNPPRRLSRKVDDVKIKSGVAKIVPSSGPTLTLEYDEFHFGSVAKGIELAHTFKFYNTGAEVLDIVRIRKT